MAWATSTRRSRLPPNWRSLRTHVLERDQHRCQTCGHRATEVDHIVAGDNHQLGNLQALCTGCHRTKTQGEAARARATRSRTPRPSEPHPGLL